MHVGDSGVMCLCELVQWPLWEARAAPLWDFAALQRENAGLLWLVNLRPSVLSGKPRQNPTASQELCPHLPEEQEVKRDFTDVGKINTVELRKCGLPAHHIPFSWIMHLPKSFYSSVLSRNYNLETRFLMLEKLYLWEAQEERKTTSK